MHTVESAQPRAGGRGPRQATALRETAKLAAFLRRDFLIALSYRAYLFSDFLALFGQAAVFYFVGRIVDVRTLPLFGGSRVTYLEYVATALILTSFLQLMAARVAFAIRQEQLYGTLEALVITPTRVVVVLVGSIAYDLAYFPLRIGSFLVVLVLAGGIHVRADGILPAAAIVVLFLPFAWGVGAATAAATVRYRRGSGGLSVATAVLGVLSGAYFPLSVLPHALARVADLNPLTTAIRGAREALLGGTGWSAVAHAALPLAVASAVAVFLGWALFRLAIERERRAGTLGLY